MCLIGEVLKRSALLLAGVIFLSPVAKADCTSPAGIAGTFQYITSAYRYCDGTSWKDTTNSTIASCSGTTAGTLTFDSVLGLVKFCNGTNWISTKGMNLGACVVEAGKIEYYSASSKYAFCDGSTLWDMTGLPAAPSAPVITTPSSSPKYTNLSSFTIAGTCTTGNTVYLTGAATNSTTCASSAFSFTVTSSVDGTYNYSIKQTDAFNQSSSSVSTTWVRETSAPAPVTITSPAANPYTSADTSYTLNGTCELSATVSWTGDSTGSVACSATGTFSIAISKSTDGNYNWNIIQTDLAGNASSALLFSWTRDTSIPANPVITSPATNPYYTNIANSSSSLVVSGTCISSLYEIYYLYNSTIYGPFACTTATPSTFTFTLNQATDGIYTYSVYQEEISSNIDSAFVTFTWVKITTAPSAPTITSPTTTYSYLSNGSTLTLSGACQSNSYGNATVALSGASTQSVTCNNGTYSFTINQTTDGTYTFQVRQQDPAGNWSPYSSTFTWTRNAGVPDTPVIISPSNNYNNKYYSNSTSITLNGNCTYTGAAGYTVTLQVNSVTQSTYTCSSSGTYTFTYTPASDNTYNISVFQTNFNSTNSGASSITWVRDTVLPTMTWGTKPTNPNFSTAASFTWSYTETNFKVTECSLNAGAYTTCTSPYSFSPVNGSYTFSVRTTDYAGNVSALLTYSWDQTVFNTMALYKFDNGAALGTDSSGFGTGSYSNTMTFSGGTTATGQTGWNLAGSLNGAATGSVAHNASHTIISGTATFEAWVRFSTLPARNTWQPIASKLGTSSLSYGWEFGIWNRSGSYFVYMRGCVTASGCTTLPTQSRSTSIPLVANTWYHVAVTFNKGSVSYYFNGTKYSSSNLGTNVSLYVPTSQPLRLGIGGTGTGATNFTGLVDEVRISQTIRYSTTPYTKPTGPFTAD